MAQLVARLNGIQKAEGSNPFNSTKKGLSEHRRIKKRYSDSFYFTKRRDAMKCVLFLCRSDGRFPIYGEKNPVQYRWHVL